MASAFPKTSGNLAGPLDGRPSPSAAELHLGTHGASPLTFRRYRVYPTARRVLLGDRDLALGGRAFDLLVTLLRARGKVVSQTEIIRQVWPLTTVNDSNLRFQVAVLRKALGSDRDVIKTIPGRGYLFADNDYTGAPGAADEFSRSEDEHGSFLSPHPPLGILRLDSYAVNAAEVSLSAAEMSGLLDVNQRLVELEQENIRLKLVIASLTLGRLAQILPQGALSGP